MRSLRVLTLLGFLLLASCGGGATDPWALEGCPIGTGWGSRGEPPGWRSWEAVPSIAHRGYGCCNPENTLEAIEAAIAIGAPAVEVDVRLTFDGVPVLMHDETIDRTTDKRGEVRRLSHSALVDANACPSGPDFCAIPTLQDALSVARGRGMLVLDLKDALTCSDLGAVADAVVDQDMSASVALISDNPRTLLLARTFLPAVPVGLYLWSDLMSPEDTVRSVEFVVEIGRAELLVRKDAVLRGRSVLVRAVKRNIPVVAWTAVTKAELDSLTSISGVRRVFVDVLP
jgi:glycerophosphoryl diester phosphodiesterase